jgi:small subunit ribosomal protein S20
MPNTTSAKKRLRQSLVRRSRNRAAKASLRTNLRKLRSSIEAQDTAGAAELYKSIQKQIDQTAAKGVIHPNAASRLKSRLSASIKKAKAS